ncbi:MAG: PQQ-binding-like beta-propeller repeat protein, partial [Planctomycetota bacterium]|nr:PQQ-binding-like beta-propeller repeat protein [Planctomycetota bacterium]
YCLVAGEADAESLAALARGYDLVFYAATRGDTQPMRNRLDKAGLYGTRVVVHRVPGPALPYTDYFANAVLFEVTSREHLAATSLADLYRLLRPCGGVARINCPDALVPAVSRALADAKVPKGEVAVDKGCVRIRRGPLIGAGEWTHQYGDPGKRVSSVERRVRLPLKAAWFGGLGPATIVSRHFREPAPLVIDGRCFIPGTDHLTAMDIYNGRTLWQRALPDLAHWPAAYRGPSLAVDHDAVYALQGLGCLRLDPATGRTLGEYKPPTGKLRIGEGAEWEYLALAGDLVVGTVGHANIKHEWWSKAYPVNHALFAIEKRTGRLRWLHKPEQGIDSNAIAIDDGKVFIIDGRPRYPFLAGRRGCGKETPAPRTLLALDLATGRVLWQTADIVPTLNSLWVDEGVVVATTSPFARSMVDPNVAKHGGGITAYSAGDGSRLWRIEETKSLAPFITEGVLYTPRAFDLATGRPLPPRAGGKGQFSAGLMLLCSTLCGCPNLAMGRQSS